MRLANNPEVKFEELVGEVEPANFGILQRLNVMLDGGGGADLAVEGRSRAVAPEGDSLSSISELLGLNLPRSTLLGTPSHSPAAIQAAARHYQCEDYKISEMPISLKVLQRNLDTIHSAQTPYYPRPFRDSPPYSDCGSPTLEQAIMMTCGSGSGGSRSNSPADSDTSTGGLSMNSIEGNINDLMVEKLWPTAPASLPIASAADASVLELAARFHRNAACM
ncbi:Cytoplasmic polyadenylation element-binding protein 1-A [Gryllus bimaculatus]|nr:Cytoplasmic polyadenylation element-binding protein 1-A [Gryllus bimaculatus]